MVVATSHEIKERSRWIQSGFIGWSHWICCRIQFVRSQEITRNKHPMDGALPTVAVAAPAWSRGVNVVDSQARREWSFLWWTHLSSPNDTRIFCRLQVGWKPIEVYMICDIRYTIYDIWYVVYCGAYIYIQYIPQPLVNLLINSTYQPTSQSRGHHLVSMSGWYLLGGYPCGSQIPWI